MMNVWLTFFLSAMMDCIRIAVETLLLIQCYLSMDSKTTDAAKFTVHLHISAASTDKLEAVLIASLSFIIAIITEC
jgi:hypothetical protein